VPSVHSVSHVTDDSITPSTGELYVLNSLQLTVFDWFVDIIRTVNVLSKRQVTVHSVRFS
jgi:hypothetical protein